MSAIPVAGSWGRVKAVKVAPDLTTPAFTWTGVTAAVIGITSWKVSTQRSGGVPQVLDFEGNADAEGVIHPTLIRGGTAEAPKVTIEGWTNIDTSTGTPIALPENAAVVLDLIFYKAGTKGYYAVEAVVDSFDTGSKVDDKSSTFTMSITVNGPLSAYLTL